MASQIITSATNPLIKKLASLQQKKYRAEENLFLVEGQRHIDGALNAGWKAEYILSDSDQPYAGTINVTYPLLQKITGRDNAEHIIAAFAPRWTELPKSTKDTGDKNPLWIGLEAVRDSGNLGTIWRTAHATQTAGIILIGQTCDPWAPECLRASMGSFANVPISKISVADFSDWAKSFHGQIIGTHLTAESKDFRSLDYRTPTLLLLGGEHAGLSKDLSRICTQHVKIPMPGGTESLNLSIAASVLMYHAILN